MDDLIFVLWTVIILFIIVLFIALRISYIIKTLIKDQKVIRHQNELIYELLLKILS